MYSRCRRIRRVATSQRQSGNCISFIKKIVKSRLTCLLHDFSRSQPVSVLSSPSSNSHHHHHHHHQQQQQHSGSLSSNIHRSATLGSTTVQAVRSSLPGGATLTPGGSSSRNSQYGSQRTGSNLSITPSVTITPTSAPPPGKSRHVSQIVIQSFRISDMI